MASGFINIALCRPTGKCNFLFLYKTSRVSKIRKALSTGDITMTQIHTRCKHVHEVLINISKQSYWVMVFQSTNKNREKAELNYISTNLLQTGKHMKPRSLNINSSSLAGYFIQWKSLQRKRYIRIVSVKISFKIVHSVLYYIMPHNRNNRNPRHHHAKADTNNNINENNNGVQPIGERENNNTVVKPCCVPTGCSTPDEMIDQENPGNSIKVFCNNDQCVLGSFMHKSCFEEWEQTVLSYLRSCGRARSWSEKQRLQNLWTKKGYDLAFKACDCRCGRGHIRKDLDYLPPAPAVDNAKKNKKKKKSEPKPAVCGKTTVNGSTVQENKPRLGSPTIPLVNNGNNTHDNNGGNNVDNNDNLGVVLIRNRTSSTGSSPPNSASSVTSGSPVPLSPLTNVIRPTTRPKFDFQTDPPQSLTAASSFFKRRHDLSAFNLLPKHKQNPYHIKMEDDGPHGNDDTRIFVLTHLSSYRVNNLKCVLCRGDLSIFDRYPLIDGTLFLSPQAYDDSVVQVISEGRLQFINAVCVTCLEGGKDIRCAACKRKWDGSALQLGSMYTYDIFAAMPCCQKRLTCKHCRRAVVDVSQGLQYYSEYSHMITCPYCKAYDFHFIRPLVETFSVKRSIWN